MKKLKYVDHRPIQLNLRSHGGKFVSLPSKSNVIVVTDEEYAVLIKRTNGTARCFEPVTEEKPARRQREQPPEEQ